MPDGNVWCASDMRSHTNGCETSFVSGNPKTYVPEKKIDVDNKPPRHVKSHPVAATYIPKPPKPKMQSKMF